MRVTSKGQVTIPVEVRERAGLLPGTEVAFEVDGDLVRLVKATGGRETRGEVLARRLWNSASAKPRLSTDEIMRLTRGE